MTSPFPFDARSRYYYYDRAVVGRRSGALGGTFSPLALAPFAWYDPSALSTLFQERTGASATTPSAVDGVVGTMLDRSGNGQHVVAPADGSRPILRNSGTLYWLEFDGSNDVLTALFALAQPWDAVSAVRIVAAGNRIFANGTTDDAGILMMPDATHIALYDGGSETDPDTVTVTVGTDIVTTERHAGASSGLAVDADALTAASVNIGTTNPNGLSIGAEADGALGTQMRFYGRVLRGTVFTAAERSQLVTYLAAKQGRAL